jgi:hypothetical protein
VGGIYSLFKTGKKEMKQFIEKRKEMKQKKNHYTSVLVKLNK